MKMKTKKWIPAVVVPAFALALIFAACQTGPRPHVGVYDVPSLQSIWADYFPMGNIIASVNFGWQGQHVADIGNPERESLLRRHFSILTAENEMKPSWVWPVREEYNDPARWGGADRIMEFAETYGFRVHGHALVWHNQSPPWLNEDGVTPAQARANMEEFINTAVGRWAGRIESWDVVNEALASWPTSAQAPVDGNWRNSLRDMHGQPVPWERRLGPDYIELAFRLARAADPSAILYYNDYNFNNRDKARAAFYMVKEINERYRAETGGTRNLIEVIGMQGHYHRGPLTQYGETNHDVAFPWPVNLADIRWAIELFRTLPGIQISITELDITVGDTAERPLTRQQERAQAIMYAQAFQIFRDHADVIRRVSIWGIDDPSSWRRRGSPLLFGYDLQPKEAFWAVANPDAFLNNTNAFLRNPRAFIDARHW